MKSKCDICRDEGEKANRDNLKGITWLSPKNIWICQRCLWYKGRQITAYN